MLGDLKFASGEHWSDGLKRRREDDGRPCLVIDRLSGPVRHVVNQIRQTRPAVQVNAVDSGADPVVAEDILGLIRRVETRSDALDAYCWAAEHQVKMGRGFWRVLTEYADEQSFDQDIAIKRIKNQFGVYFDPGSVELDGHDATFALIPEDVRQVQAGEGGNARASAAARRRRAGMGERRLDPDCRVFLRRV